MNIEKRRQMYTHIAVSSVGGFFGGYAIVNFFEIFANAQTANMIHFVSSIIHGDFSNIIYIIISMLTYIASNVFCVLYKKYIGKNLRTLSLILDFIVVALIAIAVNFTTVSYVLIPIIFAMPIQWNAFSDDAGYASSTIFSTNNLRQAVMSLVSYLTDKDKAQLDKAKFFWLTLLCFHLGVAFACVVSIFAGARGIIFGIIPIALSAAFYSYQRNAILKLRIKFRRFKRTVSMRY